MAAIRDPAWFAEVVRHASDLAGQPTQAALAQAAGLSLNTVANIVTAARASYRPGTLEQLAAGLDVEPVRLLACATTGTASRTGSRRTGAGAWVGMTALDAASRLRTPAVIDEVPSSAAVFVVSVDGVDASVVERALQGTLARLAKRHAGAAARVRPLP